MNFELPVIGEKVKPYQSLALHVMIAFALIGFGIISYVFYAFTYIVTKSKSPLFDLKLWGIIMIVNEVTFLEYLSMLIMIRKRVWKIFDYRRDATPSEISIILWQPGIRGAAIGLSKNNRVWHGGVSLTLGGCNTFGASIKKLNGPVTNHSSLN